MEHDLPLPGGALRDDVALPLERRRAHGEVLLLARRLQGVVGDLQEVLPRVEDVEALLEVRAGLAAVGLGVHDGHVGPGQVRGIHLDVALADLGANADGLRAGDEVVGVDGQRARRCLLSGRGAVDELDAPGRA